MIVLKQRHSVPVVALFRPTNPRIWEYSGGPKQPRIPSLLTRGAQNLGASIFYRAPNERGKLSSCCACGGVVRLTASFRCLVCSRLASSHRIVPCLSYLLLSHLVLSCVTRRFESAPPRGATRRPSPRSSATWSGSWAGGEKTSNTNTCTSSSRTPSERRYFCVDETVCARLARIRI